MKKVLYTALYIYNVLFLSLSLSRTYQSKPQRFSNFFQVGTTFISQNVLRTALLLSPLKANCLRFSTIVCDTQFTLIWFFLSFFGLMFNPRGPQGQNPRTTCGPRTTVWETLNHANDTPWSDGKWGLYYTTTVEFGSVCYFLECFIWWNCVRLAASPCIPDSKTSRWHLNEDCPPTP
jgi:hypothetical protein